MCNIPHIWGIYLYIYIIYMYMYTTLRWLRFRGSRLCAHFMCRFRSVQFSSVQFSFASSVHQCVSLSHCPPPTSVAVCRPERCAIYIYFFLFFFSAWRWLWLQMMAPCFHLLSLALSPSLSLSLFLSFVCQSCQRVAGGHCGLHRAACGSICIVVKAFWARKGGGGLASVYVMCNMLPARLANALPLRNK